MDEKKVEKYVAKPLFVSETELCDELGEVSAHEIIMNKRKIIDAKPVHVGVSILQHSKLLMLR